MLTSMTFVLTLFSLVKADFNINSVVVNGNMPFDVEVQNEEKHPSSLRYVYAFFRHGIRSPVFDPYPNDPYKSQYHKLFPGPPGTLTEIGKKVMYDVGKHLKLRYGNFVGNYTSEKVHVSSTNTTRTMMTALTIMAGMFHPQKKIFEDLDWQPIPVWEERGDMDKAYIYNDYEFPLLGTKVCPNYGTYLIKGNDNVINPDETKDRQVMYKLLQEYTGDKNVTSKDKLYRIWDTLQFQSMNGLPLPKWATELRPDLGNKRLYPDIMEPVMVDWFNSTEYLNKSSEMLNFYSGPLFNSIHQQLLKKSETPHSLEKFRVHTTHDTTLFAILWALGQDRPLTIGPGDGIIFELHHIADKPQVKTFYYDTNNGHSISEIPLCSKSCSLEDFMKATPSLTPDEWQAKCIKS